METILIVIGLVLLIVLPFVINHRIQKNKHESFLKHFSLLALKHNSVISKHDFWKNSFAIGIDENSKKVFYMRRTGSKEVEKMLDLNDISGCSFRAAGASLKGSEEDISLRFAHRETGNTETSFIFYDGEDAMSICDEEIPLVEKWCTIINSNLGKGKK